MHTQTNGHWNQNTVLVAMLKKSYFLTSLAHLVVGIFTIGTAAWHESIEWFTVALRLDDLLSLIFAIPLTLLVLTALAGFWFAIDLLIIISSDGLAWLPIIGLLFFPLLFSFIWLYAQKQDEIWIERWLLSFEAEQRLSEVEPVSPRLFRQWLHSAGVSVLAFISMQDELESLLVKFLERIEDPTENNHSEDPRIVIRDDSDLRRILGMLVDTPLSCASNDLIWINREIFDAKTLRIVQLKGADIAEYTPLNLLKIDSISLAEIKLLRAVFPYLQTRNTAVHLLRLDRIVRLATKLIRKYSTEGQKSISILEVSQELDVGFLTAHRVIELIEWCLKQTRWVAELDDEERAEYEQYSRQIEEALNNGEIEEVNNVGEIANLFELDSILTAFAITHYYVSSTKKESPDTVDVYPHKVKLLELSEESWMNDWATIKASMKMS